MKSKKIILFIVEGISDQTSLALVLSKLFNNDTVRFHVVGGDVTSNHYTNANNAIKKVNDELKKFLDRNKFLVSDINQIIHIVDMDGAYVPENNIVEDSSVSNIIYKEKQIICNNVSKVIVRNERKSTVIDKLSTTSKIRKIPYSVYYFSCNLEHVLHNIRNAKKEEKDKFADEFTSTYYNHEKEFVDFIADKALAVDGTYLETWKYIKQETNSLDRHSNFHLVFKI